MIEKVGDSSYRIRAVRDDDSIDIENTVLSLKRWSRERTLDLETAISIISPKVESDNNILRIGNDSLELRYYEQEPVLVEFDSYDSVAKAWNRGRIHQRGLGGVEQDIIFKTRPPFNTVRYNINLTGLTAHIQPDMTPQMLKEGWSCPENVVGSIALYHSERRHIYNSRAEAEKYRSGKFGHIYCAYLIDALNNRSKCSYRLEGNSLYIDMDRQFLDNATYPVRLDPTFGIESAGAGEADFNGRFGGSWAAPGSDGTVDTISHYVTAWGGSVYAKCALYVHSTAAFVANSGTNEVQGGGTGDWKNWTPGGSASVSNGVNYTICGWANGNFKVAADSVSSDGERDSETYNGWPDPASFTTLHFEWSSHVDYTEGGGDVTCTPTTATLSITTYIPTITVSDNITVTPTTLALTTTLYAPSIDIDVVCTPTTASLSTTFYAPTIDIDVVCTPTTASLSLTTFIPTVDVTADVTCTPTTASLTITGYAPAIDIDVVCTPTTVSLSTNTYEPSIVEGTVLTPTTASLSVATYAPTIETPMTVTPTTASLSITTYAPDVQADVVCTPTTASLSLSTFAPEVETPVVCTPTIAALVLALYAPTVTATANVTCTPTTLALALTAYAPTITVPGTMFLVDVIVAKHRDIAVVSTKYRDVEAVPTLYRDLVSITIK